ncbi:SulP family inorganic anion transporter [Prauserella flavalba]|uniref:SulP family inorganic anion transporter n=1 Tax=Prauserella flavalba TaxID=1477506 RepID=UPI0036E0C335
MRTPVFRSLAGYRPSWWRRDLVAGMTVWAVLVPDVFAYATIAGVPPVVGLYAAPAALVLYAAFGSSRHLVTGPMSVTAALSAAAVAGLAGGHGDRVIALTTGLAVVAGVIAIAAGLLRLGVLAAFISQPVLKGFILGLALTITAGQVPKLLGVEKGQRLVRCSAVPACHAGRPGAGAADAARPRSSWRSSP